MNILSAGLYRGGNTGWCVECETDDEDEPFMDIREVEFDSEGFICSAEPYASSEARARLIALIGQDRVWHVEESYRDIMDNNGEAYG